MANPFLFGDPVPSSNEPPNPFLMGGNMGGDMGASAQMANPFMAAAAPQMPQQPQGGFFGAPMQQAAPPPAAANPFAAFGAMPAAPQPQAAFGAPSVFGSDPVQQQQPPQPSNQQQYQGQFGQYTQVTADSTGQTEVTPSSGHKAETPVAAPAASNPFENFSAATPTMEATPPAPEPPKPEVVSEPPPPPPPVEVEKEEPVIVAPVVEEEPPPPPPPEPQIIEPQPEVEAKPSEESLPPPPPQVEEIEKVVDQIKITEPEPPTPTEEPVQISEPEPEVTENGTKEEGFSGIFNSENETGSQQLGVDSMAAAISTSDLRMDPQEDQEEVNENASEVKKPPTPPSSPESEVKAPEPIGGLGASLFGTSDAPMAGGEGKVTMFGAPSDSDSDDEGYAAKVSTGDAIFADIPAVPEYNSTGANLFGASEEAASNTTGATLFEVAAPREARPELGSMTGWDAAFDQKFDSASGVQATKPGDPFDPFGGPKGVSMTGAAAFGVEEDGFGGDDFSAQKAPQATPLIARRNGTEENPFLAMADGEKPELEDGPLYDDDTSQPLETFPRVHDKVDGWEMYIRHPPKKKMTANRFWKKIYVKLTMQGDNPCIQLFDTKDSKDAFQETPLQPAYSLSDISHQVFDQYSKIFTLKLQYISYKERAGIRPGQVSKMQKLTGKLGFLAKAVEDADYQGVKEFASDMKKLGVPLEHAPTVSELLKLGSTSFDDLKQFSVAVEEKLFRMDALRDRSITYKTEEIQLNAVDEVYVEQSKTGRVTKQLCRVRVFFLSFLSGNINEYSTECNISIFKTNSKNVSISCKLRIVLRHLTLITASGHIRSATAFKETTKILH